MSVAYGSSVPVRRRTGEPTQPLVSTEVALLVGVESVGRKHARRRRHPFDVDDIDEHRPAVIGPAHAGNAVYRFTAEFGELVDHAADEILQRRCLGRIHAPEVPAPPRGLTSS